MPRRPESSLRAENEELRLRLEEAEQALEAIRTGQVESLVVEGPGGPRIFSLEGATHSYRVLVEAMNEGAVTLAEDGTILYCNGRFAAMLDQPLPKVMGSAFREHVAQRCREALDHLLEKAGLTGVREELALYRANGEEIPAYLSISSIVDAGTHVRCIVATDLREHRRHEALAAAEQRVRESEERLRDTLRYAEAGVWEWDIDSGRIFWSPENFALYGIPPSEGLDFAAWERSVHPDDVAATNQAIRAAVDGRAAEYRAEFRVLHPERGTRWLLGVGRIDRHADGSARRLLGLNLDITDRKRAEEEVRLADQRKGEFLGVLSHELRNPLAPIRNSVYLLDRAPPESAQAIRAKEVIRRQTDHLARLIDDLLDVTRISRGKIQLKREQIDLRDAVRRATDDLRAMYEHAGIELRLEDAIGPVWVDADATRVAQIVGNLLQNSLKFTPAGGSVTVRVAGAGVSAQLSVTDTGLGIEPDQIERMFEPFAQADTDLARTKGGLGLGLALVKGLAELHGGSARAHSDGLGRGAVFTVELPTSKAAIEPPPEEALFSQTAPRLVVVIEDNLDAGQSLADVLELYGHRVRVARDARSGLTLVRDLRPEVVLCDLGLPDLDGYEVARTLRSEEAFRTTKLIAISGYAQPEDRRRSQEAGFNGHLAKPTSISELLSALNEPIAGQTRTSQ